jgi:cell division protein FtsW
MNLIDKKLLFAIMCLTTFGLIMLLSASFPKYGFAKFNSQIVFVFIGLFAATIIWNSWLGMGINFLKKHPKIVYWTTCILLAMVFLPIDGNHTNGSTRWITFPGFKLQPSEIAKLSIVIVMASILNKYKTHDVKGTLLTIAAITPFSALLLMETDIGATLLISVTAFVMVFISGTKFRYFFGAGVILAVLLGVGIYVFLDNRVDRIGAFLSGDGAMDSQRASAMLGVIRGGFFGIGIGASLQKLGVLPEAHNDMILAIIGEETGAFGLILLLGLFSYIYFKGFVISRHSLKVGNIFNSHLAFGITFILTIQTLLNFSVNLSIIPPKGVTLPLVSYGGSSAVMVIIMLGILLKIDTENKTKKYK